MRRIKQSKWVWYFIVAAVTCGLLAPTMFANAAVELERYRCPIPATGDVL
ncbi:MAG: hypothetical protein HUU46_13930 [Candidatus Hydrogenedentes bacterium]|nr:hypothetical protein [Candidatus Hydrogenedentota bacterium]